MKRLWNKFRRKKPAPILTMEDYFNDPAVIAHYQEVARKAGVVVRNADGEWIAYRRGPRSWSQYRYIVGADADDPWVGHRNIANVSSGEPANFRL